MNLAELRTRAGLTQHALAERSGIAQPHISRLERLPVDKMSQRQLRRYLSALGARLLLVAEIDGHQQHLT
ncbi:XRE family transcriptional regulator [Streptomyces sp. ET3-23]|uniref:XRE family transcriptional regulator n=1 Tax=Streptomyces sp. ET3-23 TaxID=2885643 RepID=UPI0027E1B607|nr:XRE family transcriptional regulator [Streptomyces sp. ET3-23]